MFAPLSQRNSLLVRALVSVGELGMVTTTCVVDCLCLSNVQRVSIVQSTCCYVAFSCPCPVVSVLVVVPVAASNPSASVCVWQYKLCGMLNIYHVLESFCPNRRSCSCARRKAQHECRHHCICVRPPRSVPVRTGASLSLLSRFALCVKCTVSCCKVWRWPLHLRRWLLMLCGGPGGGANCGGGGAPC